MKFFSSSALVASVFSSFFFANNNSGVVVLVRAEEEFMMLDDDVLMSWMTQGTDILTKCNIDYNAMLESSMDMMGQLAIMEDGGTFDGTLRDMLDPLNMECNDSQTKHFHKTLDDFYTCSSIDLRVVIESALDAWVGTLIQCILGGWAMREAGLSPREMLPELCIESFLGQNPVGDLLRSYLLYPDQILPCFTTLSKGLPPCTLEAWPIPLFGSILKKATCVLGGTVTLIDEMAEMEAAVWSECLPQDDKTSCEDIIERCSTSSVTLQLPQQFQGVPLSDAVLRAAKDNDLLQRYNDFVDKCLPDRWVGWAYEMGAYEDSQTYNARTSATTASSYGSSSSSTSLAAEKTSTAQKAAGGGGSFKGGFLAGLVVVGAAWAFTIYKSSKPSRERENLYTNVEMIGGDLTLT